MRPDPDRRRHLLTILFIMACVVAYFPTTLLPSLRLVRASDGFDLASYYYALHAALSGADPYDAAGLSERSRAEGGTDPVHPFFYPPPALLFFLPAAPFSLRAVATGFYFLNQVALAASLVSIWILLGRGRALAVFLAFVLLTYDPIDVNNRWGQVNLWVLLLILGSLLLLEKGRESGAGAALGAAAMLKISPALLVGWLALRGHRRAVAGAAGAAILTTLASLPLVAPAHQVRFYTEVLPEFRAGGDYSGLAISLRSVGVHSLPRLWHLIFPNPDSRSILSAAAATASSIGAAALLAGVVFALRPRVPVSPGDPIGRHLEIGAIMVLMVILPVFAYDHHLVLLLPALAGLWQAIVSGKVPVRWLVPLAPAYLCLALPRETHRAIYELVGLTPSPHGPLLRGAVLELKLIAACVVLAACVAGAKRMSRPPIVTNDLIRSRT